MKYLMMIVVLLVLLTGCRKNEPNAGNTQASGTGTYAGSRGNVDNLPQFDGEKAYKFLSEQCEIGPRYPGSEGIKECRNYIIEKLEIYGAKVTEQEFVTDFDGNKIRGVNIEGRFHPHKERRILLGAHYDTRPWSDKEEDESLHSTPVPGGNDGASGVAVLLEVGRLLSINDETDYGVDLVFFDQEDSGNYDHNETWCIGSRYYAEHYERELPEKAVIVDMIGDKDLEIPMDYFSYHNSPLLVREIWDTARKLGIKEFKSRIDNGIYDDHYTLLEKGFNAVVLIDFDYQWWHTIEDTADKCSAESLEKVGRVLVNMLYAQ